jgi:hypothetical protein
MFGPEMPHITVGTGATIEIAGVDFPLKPGSKLEVASLASGELFELLELTEEQRRLLQLGATLFGGNDDRKPAPARGARSSSRNGASTPDRKRAVRETFDPWSGERVYSPGFSHLSDETRALTGVETDRGKAKALGEALRSARERNASGVGRVVEQYGSRFRKADAPEKKKLLAELVRELKAL